MFAAQVGYAQKLGCSDVEVGRALDQAAMFRSWSASMGHTNFDSATMAP